MADDQTQDESQKTEEPTPRKLAEAKRKGQVAISRELNHWLVILTGLIIVMLFVPIGFPAITRTLHPFIAMPDQFPLAPQTIGPLVSQTAKRIGLILLAPMLLLVAVALLGGLAQTGMAFSAEQIKPRLSKLSIPAGIKRQFSLRSVMEFLKGILKIAIVGIVVALLLAPALSSIDHFAGLPIPPVMSEIRILTLRMMGGVLGVMTVIAALDLLYQRFEFRKKLRMSRQEIKDEFKQTEGDPMVRARLRQLRMEKARRRMMQAVPNADVVITNPTHFAVALQYDMATMHAPILLAKGADAVAARIRTLALEHDIPIIEEPPLARAIFESVELDEEIPPAHYKAVAEIISYVFKLKKHL
ncbi:MAG: flagellar biosynthesis protein FlhB [Pseudomonadota bacterium]|nr:flagellar biosynthesis protein FlhB [Pseudomonadota bacterium]